MVIAYSPNIKDVFVFFEDDDVFKLKDKTIEGYYVDGPSKTGDISKLEVSIMNQMKNSATIKKNESQFEIFMRNGAYSSISAGRRTPVREPEYVFHFLPVGVLSESERQDYGRLKERVS